MNARVLLGIVALLLWLPTAGATPVKCERVCGRCAGTEACGRTELTHWPYQGPLRWFGAAARFAIGAPTRKAEEAARRKAWEDYWLRQQGWTR